MLQIHPGFPDSPTGKKTGSAKLPFLKKGRALILAGLLLVSFSHCQESKNDNLTDALILLALFSFPGLECGVPTTQMIANGSVNSTETALIGYVGFSPWAPDRCKPHRATGPFGSLEYHYDSSDRFVSSIFVSEDNGFANTVAGYDSNGYPATLIQISAGGGNPNFLKYDSTGKLIYMMSDVTRGPTNFIYDSTGRLTEKQGLDTGMYEYFYYEGDRLTSAMGFYRGNGPRYRYFEYNSNNQLTAEIIFFDNEYVDYTSTSNEYNYLPIVMNFYSYNDLGQIDGVYKVEKGDGSTTINGYKSKYIPIAYTQNGQLKQMGTKEIGRFIFHTEDETRSSLFSTSSLSGTNSTNTIDFQHSYTFDAEKRAVSIVATDNIAVTTKTTTISWDAQNRPTSIRVPDGSISSPATCVSGDTRNFTYTPTELLSANLKCAMSGGGSYAQMDVSHQADGKITAITHASDEPGFTSQAQSFTYNPTGNVATTYKEATATTTSFTYDANNKITAVDQGGPVDRATWDGASRLTAYENSSTATTASFTLDDRGRIGSYTNSAAGALTVTITYPSATTHLPSSESLSGLTDSTGYGLSLSLKRSISTNSYGLPVDFSYVIDNSTNGFNFATYTGTNNYTENTLDSTSLSMKHTILDANTSCEYNGRRHTVRKSTGNFTHDTLGILTGIHTYELLMTTNQSTVPCAGSQLNEALTPSIVFKNEQANYSELYIPRRTINSYTYLFADTTGATLPAPPSLPIITMNNPLTTGTIDEETVEIKTDSALWYGGFTQTTNTGPDANKDRSIDALTSTSTDLLISY